MFEKAKKRAGEQWVDNWNKCSQYYYTRPRKGMFKVGWPKADVVADMDLVEYRKKFNKEHGLVNTRKTVLYAPAWENDYKQNDFIQAMLQLDVNILIKQSDADPKKFPQVVANIKEMRELHKDIPDVTILPPATNIFNAIMASDILVSEELSTMSEAAMVGVPAVSVSNWLIPDVTPSRYPECNYDFVVMTKKETLKECIEKMLNCYDTYKKATEEYAEKNFSNVGKSCEMIMDIIDDAILERPIRYPAIEPKTNKKVCIKNKIILIVTNLKREIHDNYCERYPALMTVWNICRFIKRLFKGKVKEIC